MDQWTWRWRLIVRGWFRESWIDAAPALRDEIFSMWIEVHRRWQEAGCRLVMTMDDMSSVGRTHGARANFYSVWEIPGPEVVRELLAPVWDEEGRERLRLAEYFALEVITGKPILTMESDLGGPVQATAPERRA